MGQFLQAVFASQGFEPHGYCFLWTRPLLWLYIVSDSLITLSYYSISIALIYFVRKRRDLAFDWVFLMFAAFIIACGTTHLMALLTIWNPLYWLDGAVKAVTAVASVATAVALWPLIPKALALPSPAQLEAANLALQGGIIERNRAQEELRRAHDDLETRVRERTKELASSAETLRAEITERKRAEGQLHLQRAALESAANAILIADREGRIIWVNPAFTRLTGYTPEEALGLNPHLLKSGKHDQAFYQNLWDTILSGQVWHGEIINRRKDGSLYTEEQTITPVRGVGGEIDHFIAIKQDVTERKRSEEALREANDTLEAVIQASPMGITILDSDGNAKLWNPAAERIFGWRQEEILGWPLPFIPPDKREEHRSFRERVLRGEAYSDAEIVRQKKDGSLIDISLSTAPLRDAKGHIWGAMGIMADITERKRAEEGRARLSAILEVTTDFVGIADIHGKAIYLNSSGRKMLGIEEDEDISNRDIADTHPEWANRVVLDEGIPSAVRDGVWSGETALLSRDGREIPVSQVILALKAPDGTVEFLSTIARDITERKRAEATRRALYQASLQIQGSLPLQERLSRILYTAQEVLELDRINVLFADPEGQWLEAVASLGTEEPLATLRVPIGPAGGALAQAYRTQKPLLWEGRTPVPEELRLQSPYDQIAAFRSRVFAIVPLVVQGRAIGVLGVDRKHSRRLLEPATLEFLQLFAAQAAIAIENSRLYEQQWLAAIQLEATVEARTRELYAANRQLAEASRHKSEFLANMSHELRTPLNSVIGFSQLLQDQTFGALSEKQGRYVANIETSGQHLLALINDLLDLSKVEAGKLELRPEPLNLADVLEASLASIRPQAEVKGQTLHLNFESVLPPLTADPVRLKQILFNLLSNAVKFTPAGGRITVTARRVPSSEFGVSTSQAETRNPKPETASVSEFVEIAVADTGIGIKAEDLPRLFQEFMQLEAAATKRYEGTGLGLALTRRLVEMHGGWIWAESAGQGRGSTFTIWLPLTSPAS